jgi:hypothetical protein
MKVPYNEGDTYLKSVPLLSGVILVLESLTLTHSSYMAIEYEGQKG